MNRAAITVIGILFAAGGAPGESAGPVVVPSSAQWCALEFEARKFFVTLEARLELALEPAATAVRGLLDPRQSEGVAPTQSKVLRVRLQSTLRNEHTDLLLLMDPVTGAALQQRRVETGDRNRVTTLRYSVGGVLRTRVSMLAGQETLPSTQWSRQRDLWRPYPSWTRQGLEVSDPAALFYLVAASRLANPGDVLQLPMYSNDRLLLVEATVRGTARSRVDYLQSDASGRIAVEGHRPILRIALDARPLDPGANESNFELAGLRGDVEMHLEPRHRLPVEVSGDVPFLGRVTLHLKRAELDCLADAESHRGS